ncbi:SDR family oxidoreductase [Parafilimonas terrae]|uniref:Farnesol dehydrogenase n=1 Tax=Parafilimonas terrae TaxID=1465490 RepID=A0A1I5USP8_9BACT|nr:SDR family oxidoreductase [Parafilimonas terrae]SFP98295.1 farnesol dehydrogenase [Parafilimonas terrae]
MKIFITGATGYVGNNLAKKLAGDGNIIHALCRDVNTPVLQHSNIKIFKGDITDVDSMDEAMQGCEQVYHLAAYARVWAKDASTFYRLNVAGAKNVFDAALKNNINNIVFTSTGGTLGPSGRRPVKEEDRRIGKPFTIYEATKTQAEELAKEYCNKYGLRIVTLNPPRIYGPGIITESNAVTRLVKLYMSGKWKIMPGDGKRTGSYVYIDDIVNGHILAMQKGRAGERYNLGGVNASYIEFFNLLAQITGGKHTLIKFPVWTMMFAGNVIELYSKLTGRPPLLTPPWIRKYYYNWDVDSSKAQRELGYSFISLEEGLKKTVEWLKNNPD